MLVLCFPGVFRLLVFFFPFLLSHLHFMTFLLTLLQGHFRARLLRGGGGLGEERRWSRLLAAARAAAGNAAGPAGEAGNAGAEVGCREDDDVSKMMRGRDGTVRAWLYVPQSPPLPEPGRRPREVVVVGDPGGLVRGMHQGQQVSQQGAR